MFSKVLNSTCQGSDKCLPIPASFHDTPLKGRCSCIHPSGYCISSSSASQIKTTSGRGFCFTFTGWNMMRSLVWNEHDCAQNNRNSNGPVMFLRFINGAMITRETFQLHNWESASNVATSPCGCPPILQTVVSVALRSCFTTAAFASTSPSTFIWSSSLPLLIWNGASVFTWITEDTMMDCLYLLLHQLADGERCQLYWVFYQTGQPLSHSMQISDAHVWISGCEACSVSSQFRS